MITESWLSENIHDSAVEIGNNYNIFRLDFANIFRPGGGVLAYVNKCIPVERITNLEEEGKEVLWLVLKPPWTPRPFSTITVIIVYYPPGQLRERENKIIEYLSNGLDELLHKRPSSGIIIAGDFNNLNLSRLCSRFSLRKTVSEVRTPSTKLLQICSTPVGRSDHQCIFLKPKSKLNVPPTTKRVRLMKPGNRIALSMKVAQENWEGVLFAQGVDKKFKRLTILWCAACPN